MLQHWLEGKVVSRERPCTLRMNSHHPLFGLFSPVTYPSDRPVSGAAWGLPQQHELDLVS